MKTIHELQEQFLRNTFYKGIPTCKNPMDLWVYQEIIHEVKPDVIIEIGVWQGGSTFFLRHQFPDETDKEIFGLDIDISKVHESVRNYSNVTFVKVGIEPFKLPIRYLDKKVLVIEDSSHTYENTLECLKLYSPLVSVGSYYIVEDTIAPKLGYDLHPGLAVEDFLRDNDKFEVDKSREKYITWNPGGYLKRVK